MVWRFEIPAPVMFMCSLQQGVPFKSADYSRDLSPLTPCREENRRERERRERERRERERRERRECCEGERSGLERGSLTLAVVLLPS